MNADEGVETRLARVEQRVSDLDARLAALTPIATNVVQLTERVDTLRRDLRSYAGQVAKLDDEIATREHDTRIERRQARFALWGLTSTIVAALIVAAVTLLTTGVH